MISLGCYAERNLYSLTMNRQMIRLAWLLFCIHSFLMLHFPQLSPSFPIAPVPKIQCGYAEKSVLYL